MSAGWIAAQGNPYALGWRPAQSTIVSCSSARSSRRLIVGIVAVLGGKSWRVKPDPLSLLRSYSRSDVTLTEQLGRMASPSIARRARAVAASAPGSTDALRRESGCSPASRWHFAATRSHFQLPLTPRPEGPGLT
jgi:hypothetical protein